MKKIEIDNRFIGHAAQMYGVTPFEYTDGKARGMRGLELCNGGGIRLVMLPDRGLDILKLEYKGVNLSYLSKGGISSPEFYIPDGYGFLKNFFVGFLTTCGLRHIGAPCRVEDEDFGLHGVISNTPAEEVCASTRSNMISVSGTVREAEIFKHNLLLRRSVEMPVGKDFFIIKNRIENIGYQKEQIMFMLHINFGYPFLSPHTEVVIPSVSVEPRDDEAAKGLTNHNIVTPPVAGYKERVFFHNLSGNDSAAGGLVYGTTACSDSDNNVTAVIKNKELGFAVSLSFSKAAFPYLTQWNQFGCGDYVLGIEPSSCKMIGRRDAIEQGTADYLMPGEYKDFDVKVKLSEID